MHYGRGILTEKLVYIYNEKKTKNDLRRQVDGRKKRLGQLADWLG